MFRSDATASACFPAVSRARATRGALPPSLAACLPPLNIPSFFCLAVGAGVSLYVGQQGLWKAESDRCRQSLLHESVPSRYRA